MNPSLPNQPSPGGLPPIGGRPVYVDVQPNIQNYQFREPQATPVPTGTNQMPFEQQPRAKFPAAPPLNQPDPTLNYPPPPLTPPAAGPTNAAPVSAKAVHPNSTQNTLQIAEIRDGIVIMNDGSYRAVVMCKAINFDLMSLQEQESVEYSYQGFLNSLYFPIQIFIHSQQIDLKPYIERLDRLRAEHDNMLLAMLIDDYVDYIDSLSAQANIMDKEFYVVIPFFPHVDPKKKVSQSKNFFVGFVGLFNNKEQHVVVNEADLENAKTELRNRVQASLSGLMQCGVQGLPLDTQELIELYYNVYNPDTATYQQLKSFNTLSSDIVTKGQGQAAQPHLQGELPQ